MTSLQRGLKSQRGPEDEPAASSIAAQSFVIARCNFQTWITQQTTDTSLWHAVCFIGYQRPLLNCSLHSLLVIDKTELYDILIFWLYGPWIDRWRQTIHAFRCFLIMVWPSLVAALRGKIFLQSDVRQLKSYSSSWSPTWKESSPHKLLNPSKIPRICFNLAIITCNQMTELQTVCERAQQTTFSTSERDRNMSQIKTKYLVFESFESQSAPNFPVGSKNIMSAEEKKTQVVLSENTKHFHFSHEWGEKKTAPNMNSAASFLLSVWPQTGTLNSFGGWWVRNVTWWLEEDVRVTERVTQRWHLRCNAVNSELLSDARQTLHTNKFWQRTSSRTSWWQRLKSFQSNVWEQQFSGQWAAFIAGTKVELWSHSFVFWYLRGFFCVWNDYFQFRLARKNMKWIKGRSRDRQEKNLVEQWNNVFCLCRQNSLLILC